MEQWGGIIELCRIDGIQHMDTAKVLKCITNQTIRYARRIVETLDTAANATDKMDKLDPTMV